MKKELNVFLFNSFAYYVKNSRIDNLAFRSMFDHIDKTHNY